MRVLLVGPDHEDNLSIRYLSATLRAAGHEAELARFNSAEDHDAVVAESAGYDVVGLSMCFQWRALEYLALADALARAGCPLVVMGGHYATCEAEAPQRRCSHATTTARATANTSHPMSPHGHRWR